MQNIHRTNINTHPPSSRREEAMKGHKHTLAGKNNLMRNGWDPAGHVVPEPGTWPPEHRD